MDEVSITGLWLLKLPSRVTNKQTLAFLQRELFFHFSGLIIYSVLWFWHAAVRSALSVPRTRAFLLLHIGTALNIWTALIKSCFDSVLLSLTDSKVIKLLKGVTGKIVVSRLRQERLIKWPLLLLSSSKAAFFHLRQTANVPPPPPSTTILLQDGWACSVFLRRAGKKCVHLSKVFFISTKLIQKFDLFLREVCYSKTKGRKATR